MNVGDDYYQGIIARSCPQCHFDFAMRRPGSLKVGPPEIECPSCKARIRTGLHWSDSAPKGEMRRLKWFKLRQSFVSLLVGPVMSCLLIASGQTGFDYLMSLIVESSWFGRFVFVGMLLGLLYTVYVQWRLFMGNVYTLLFWSDRVMRVKDMLDESGGYLTGDQFMEYHDLIE